MRVRMQPVGALLPIPIFGLLRRVAPHDLGHQVLLSGLCTAIRPAAQHMVRATGPDEARRRRPNVQHTPLVCDHALGPSERENRLVAHV